MMERYTLENLRKVLGQPGYVGWELQRLLFDLKHGGDAVDVMDEDWDNLVLLDACRYDYFETQNDIPGELSRVVSHGGRSWEFMQGNFVGEQFHDTVYVTGNPHTEKLRSDVFHAVEPLYLNAWDDERETVLPGDVVEAAVAAHEEYPNKRLLVHFMQPHRPYLGETGERLRDQFQIRGFNRRIAHDGARTDQPSFSTLMERGEIPIDMTRQAYRETLDIVLDHTKELVDELSGKSVVSADHGEMLGETLIPGTRPKFGHSLEYIRNETLYVVPWLDVPADDRRTITSEDPIEFEGGDSNTVEERLQFLGYK
ncbi:hypothetical protein DU500_15420 [Haloplanus rubicundus]|uniref:Sulfatase N-terminal domain-containing protein n=1 Tax=Haloplanus rubicundus TaxID=1547898 RepID=A0A345EG05_9EURY|nr:hypothetical protein [Haloplanus rubicundus]AXG07708.1 hypothetical protein DU500_15420 [Haloplanus rubicundus]AXG11127.1 hypothetical protein DU484_15400 [Haloplanus rubicundus]